MKEPDLDHAAGIIGLLEHVMAVADETQKISLMKRISAKTTSLTVFFLNAHAVNLAWEDAQLAKLIRGSDILLRDGIGLKLLFKCMGRQTGINMNGTDFIPRLLLHLKGERIALWGTQEPYLTAARDRLLAEGHNIVSIADGFREPDEYLQLLRTSTADVVILGMGMPKQERFADMLRRSARTPVIIVAGGAIIDFISGRFPRAPETWRRCGLEWLFRLIQEPRRLAGRYLTGGLRFAGRAICLTWKSRSG